MRRRIEIWMKLDDARQAIIDWQQEMNELRPALAQQTEKFGKFMYANIEDMKGMLIEVKG